MDEMSLMWQSAPVRRGGGAAVIEGESWFGGGGGGGGGGLADSVGVFCGAAHPRDTDLTRT